MASTTEILEAFNEALQAAALGVPVGWSGVDFKPPQQGQQQGLWLEAQLFPNEPQDPLLAAGPIVARGFYQVLVGGRPNFGEIRMSELADRVIAAFPKASQVGPVYVSKTPWRSPLIREGAQLLIPVTIPYRALVC